MSLVMYWLNKKEKKSLATNIATITTAKLPIIAADLISLLTMIDYSVYKITGKVVYFVISFFGISMS